MLRFARLAALLVLVLAVVAVAGQAHAQTTSAPGAIIQVTPGPNAIRKALKQANPGDTLNIHTGTYLESVRVRKANLTLKKAGDGPVIIDAQCNSVTAINVEAEGVTILGLTVRGASYYAINLEHIFNATIRGNTVTNTCEGADYGVNLFDTGPIQVIGNTGTGWEDAVIYVGGIVDTGSGTLVVKKTKASASFRGIIVEDSTGVNIDVLRNKVFNNSDTGIYVHNTDNTEYRFNTVTNNGNNGIWLDSNSDSNIITGNAVSGHTFDLNNEGSDNCFFDNSYTTSNGTIAACSK